MIYECAPMEGVTGDLFRQAQARHFQPCQRYYTPFLSTTSSRTLAAREMRELDPKHNAGLNVMEARSNAEILTMVDRFAAECPSKALIAFGASPYSVAARCLVSREELDAVTHGKPLFMVKYDGHACVVNTALL